MSAATAVQARSGRFDPVSVVRAYVVVLGAALLVEGGTLLVLDRLAISVAIDTTDTRHNLLHVVWGLALLGVSVAARGRHARRAVWAALVFGAFYVALGVLGLTLERPFGMQLGPAENAFHFTVGPLALALGVWALTSISGQPVPIHTAGHPARSRTGLAIRRRSHRRHGSGRAGRRRR